MIWLLIKCSYLVDVLKHITGFVAQNEMAQGARMIIPSVQGILLPDRG